VGQAISRFGKRVQTVAELRRSVTRIEKSNCQKLRCDPKFFIYSGLDLDHRYSQTAFPELSEEPWNLDLKPAVENRGPKAAWEKELLHYEEDLMQRTGWTRDEVRQRVTQSEWDSIANTVHPTYRSSLDSLNH
jgi:hypothetical protein